MSQITMCNYCALKHLRAKAEREGSVVTLKRSTELPMGGTDVYLHPKDVSVEDLIRSSELHDKYFCAWLMEIPDHCVC